MAVVTVRWPHKDPDDVADYTYNWLTRLNGDTIESASWIISPDNKDTACQQTNASNTTTTHTIWLSGGTAGVTYLFTSRITTAGGRILDQRCIVKVV